MIRIEAVPNSRNIGKDCLHFSLTSPFQVNNCMHPENGTALKAPCGGKVSDDCPSVLGSTPRRFIVAAAR